MLDYIFCTHTHADIKIDHNPACLHGHVNQFVYFAYQEYIEQLYQRHKKEDVEI